MIHRERHRSCVFVFVSLLVKLCVDQHYCIKKHPHLCQWVGTMGGVDAQGSGKCFSGSCFLFCRVLVSDKRWNSWTYQSNKTSVLYLISPVPLAIHPHQLSLLQFLSQCYFRSEHPLSSMKSNSRLDLDRSLYSYLHCMAAALSLACKKHNRGFNGSTLFCGTEIWQQILLSLIW